MRMSRYDLSKCSWRIKGTAPYVPLRENSMETGKPLEGITGWVPADVPGGVALALYRAGYIPHPYWGMNSLQCEWIENKWWIYETELTLPEKAGKRVRLDFGGVDYDCSVYWNGVLLGGHTGMYDPFCFDVTEHYRAGERVVLRVLIRHAPDEMGQIGKTSETFTQKSRFNYKWDFSTRLVNLGIWQKACLTFWDGVMMDDLFTRGEPLADGTGRITVSGRIAGREEAGELRCEALRFEAECSLDGQPVGSACAAPGPDGAFSLVIPLEKPALWYPNGLGEQPLYDLTVRLYRSGELLEEERRQVGVRSIALVQNDGAPEGARPYLFVVNGRRMYVKGVNITPLDHIYGDVPPEQVEETLKRAKEMHCNLVRVWGGGLIETEEFYNCCDRMGLLVWQEFIQSSSGIDNIPSEKPEFLSLLQKSAEAAVRAKRSHPSLAVWSGGNELMEADRTPCTEENRNIAMLREIVNRLDPGRAFLPTSASGPSEFISGTPGQSHDVHGWWQYQGNPGQYRFFGGSDSLFHSEFGCDGMSSLASLQKILPPEELRPVAMRENDVWRFHGDWWCTYERESTMFGGWKGIGQYIACSQWMQAEGLRYILEANRRRCFRNSGSIIWQLNEPWPNISCTNLLEYHGAAKMAYFWAKDAFRPVHPVFDYQKLDYAPGEELAGRLTILRDQPGKEGGSLLAEIFDLRGERLFSERYAPQSAREGAEEMGALCWRVPENLRGVFLLRLTACADGAEYQNSYYFSTETEHPYRPALCEGARLTGHARQEGESFVIEVENTGDAAALHVRIADRSDCFLLDLEENFFTLLPGEKKTLRAGFRKKFRFGFDENLRLAAEKPELWAESLCGAEARLG